MYGQKTIINDCLMIDTLNTFLLPDYAFSIDGCYLPIKLTIAPWNKRNLDSLHIKYLGLKTHSAGFSTMIGFSEYKGIFACIKEATVLRLFDRS